MPKQAVHVLMTVAVVAAGDVVVAPPLSHALALARALAAAAAVAIAVADVAAVSVVAVVVVAVADFAVSVAGAIVPESKLAALGDDVAAGTVNHIAGMIAMSLAYSSSDHTEHCGCVVHKIAGSALFLLGLELFDVVEWMGCCQVDWPSSANWNCSSLLSGHCHSYFED